MTATTARTATTDAVSTVGVLRVGPARVAVTLAVLREVLPCPENLEPLPAAGAGLLGVLNVRGAVVPVLDLRLLLGWPAERGAEQIVTVVSVDDRVIGLLCDEVLGVSRLADASLQRLTDTDGDLLFSHSFERPEDGRIVSVLDVERLLRLPGIPAAHPQSDSDPDRGSVDPVRRADPVDEAAVEIVVVSCGSVRFGLDVASVHALLPDVDLTPSPLVGALCNGVTGYAERSIAAVPLLRLVGLADGDDPAVNGGLILRYSAADRPGYVALLVSEVIEIVRVPDAQLLPLPAVLAEVAGWFGGLVALPGTGDVLVLDPAQLAGDPDLATLAALNTGRGTGPEAGPHLPGPRSGEPDGDASETGAVEPPAVDAGAVDARGDAVPGSATVGVRYLTYVVGIEVATPLLQVSEIITFPEAWTPIRRPEAALLGVFTHRGVVVPLVCLTSLLSTSVSAAVTANPDDPDRRVVMVTVPGGTVGFIVPTLRAIEVSTWEESVQPVQPGQPQGGPGGFPTPAEAAAVSHVVRVGAEDRDRNLRTVDLAAVATALTAATPGLAHPVATG